MCGVPVVSEVFRALDEGVTATPLLAEGAAASAPRPGQDRKPAPAKISARFTGADAMKSRKRAVPQTPPLAKAPPLKPPTTPQTSTESQPIQVCSIAEVVPK